MAVQAGDIERPRACRVQTVGSCLMWVLATEFGSSGRAPSILNHGGDSPVPEKDFEKCVSGGHKSWFLRRLQFMFIGNGSFQC